MSMITSQGASGLKKWHREKVVALDLSGATVGQWASSERCQLIHNMQMPFWVSNIFFFFDQKNSYYWNQIICIRPTHLILGSEMLIPVMRGIKKLPWARALRSQNNWTWNWICWNWKKLTIKTKMKLCCFAIIVL